MNYTARALSRVVIAGRCAARQARSAAPRCALRRQIGTRLGKRRSGRSWVPAV